jgi:hypothetical protein
MSKNLKIPVSSRMWRKWHNEDLNKIFSSPNVTRMIKSRKMRWLEQVSPPGRTKKAILCFGKETYKVDQDEDGSAILCTLLMKLGRGCGLDLFSSRRGLVLGACEHGNESSVSIKEVEFVDYQLLKKNHPTWCSSLCPVFG